MKIKHLKVDVDGISIRDIKFHDGLNLVVNQRGVGRTGNSIGKTTVARLVDYLFGGGVESIYIDEEFKKPNPEIELLLNSSDVVVSLCFIDLSGADFEIARNVCIDKKLRKFWIQGKTVDEGEFFASVMSRVLDITGKRPSMRFVAPKFIRDSGRKMLNTTHFLDKRASPKDYAELFLYLFGFEDTALLEEKRLAANAVSKAQKRVSTINALVKEQKPGAEVAKYRAKLKVLEDEFLRFDYSPKFDNPVSRLSEIQVKEDELVGMALDVSAKISNVERTLEILGGAENGYLSEQVHAIYSYVEVAIDGPIRDLKKVLNFHAELVEAKKAYLGIDLPTLYARKNELEYEISSLTEAKLEVFADMRSEESIARITQKLKELGDLKIELGRVEGLLEQQRRTAADLLLAQEQYAKLLLSISQNLDLVHRFHRVFNRYFAYVSKSIHGEIYSFDFDFNEESGICSLDVISGSSNPEGGKKKAEVIAFDLAYILTINKFGLVRPKFVFHDSIEDIDTRQIQLIFKVAKRLPGQQIVSMLVDKFDPLDYEKYSSAQILELSEFDKFFRVR